MMPRPLPTTAYFPAMTGMRAVAAFMVYFFHFNPFRQLGHATTDANHFWAALLDKGSTGVTFFFVLSGFLITVRYLDRVEPSRAWVQGYLLKRFARIYPLYFFLTVPTFIAMAGHLWTWYTWDPNNSVGEKLFSLIANLTLTRALFQDVILQGIPTAWTLTVEECFYLSAPAMLLVLRKRPALLPLFVPVLLGTGILLWLLAEHLHAYGHFMQPLGFVIHNTYFGVCTEFLVGIGLALWMRKRGNGPARGGTTALGIALVGACLVGMVAIDWHYLPTREWPSSLPSLLINTVLLPIGIAVLFNGLIHERTWLQHILSTRLFTLLGKSSYAFYLVHIGLFSTLLERAIGLHIFLAFIIFNIAAILLYQFVEHPAQVAILRRFRPEAAVSPLLAR